MADIKTRDVVKGTIKKIDKAAIAAYRKPNEQTCSVNIMQNGLRCIRRAQSER